MNKRYYVAGFETDLSKISPLSSSDIDVSRMARSYTHTLIPYEGNWSLIDFVEFIDQYKDDPSVKTVEIEDADDSWSSPTIALNRVTVESDEDFNNRKKQIQVSVYHAWKQYQAEINKVKLTPEQKKMARLEKLAAELGVKIKK